ncbi:MAG TPA: hypothetical protein VFI70_06575 [Nitrososphaeraceae archaeon]|nr:hypothetical protein [Nitrososphaeraceae archaeon]
MTPKKISAIFVISFSLLIITLAPTTSVFLDNISYAQLPNSPTPPQQPSPTATLPADAVTITSPKDGQQVPVGQDLQVTGTSNPNAASDCKITVNLNRIRPNQPVVANGPGGANDYSQWSFTITPNYAPIQEGQNRISARISCDTNTLKQFAHVNVTGVAQ